MKLLKLADEIMLIILFLVITAYPNNSFAQNKQEGQKKYIKLQVFVAGNKLFAANYGNNSIAVFILN